MAKRSTIFKAVKMYLYGVYIKATMVLDGSLSEECPFALYQTHISMQIPFL